MVCILEVVHTDKENKYQNNERKLIPRIVMIHWTKWMGMSRTKHKSFIAAEQLFLQSKPFEDNGLESLWLGENPDSSVFTCYSRISGIRSKIERV